MPDGRDWVPDDKWRSWASVLCIGVVFWGFAVLGKHVWSHEAWGRAVLAGVPYGMLATMSAGGAARTARRGRRGKVDMSGPPPLPPGVPGSARFAEDERGGTSLDDHGRGESQAMRGQWRTRYPLSERTTVRLRRTRRIYAAISLMLLANFILEAASGGSVWWVWLGGLAFLMSVVSVALTSRQFKRHEASSPTDSDS